MSGGTEDSFLWSRAWLFDALKYLPWSVLLTALTLVPLLLNLCLPQFLAGGLLFRIFFGVSAQAFLQCRIFNRSGFACL